MVEYTISVLMGFNFWLGVMLTKWAIEYEQPAGEAFSQNHPEGHMFIDNCNVILRFNLLSLSLSHSHSHTHSLTQEKCTIEPKQLQFNLYTANL